MPAIRRTGSGKAKYPLATIAFYGPDNQRASKMVVGVFKDPEDEGSLRKWFSENGDIREDPAVTAEVTEFLKQEHVAESVINEQIMGCPHEEVKDYPEGGVCPTCSFWWNVNRFTHEPMSGPKVGRNDPCSCGSGKKYKKCCGSV